MESLARAFGGTPCGVTSAALLEWAGGREWATETRRSHYASYRQFFQWLHGTGRIDADPARELPHIRPSQPRPKAAPPIAVETAKRRSTARERLMVRLGVEAGLRRAEIAVVHRTDMLRDLDGWSLLVHGKGGYERIIPLTDDLAGSLWAATSGGYAFPGRIEGHLSPRRVGELLRDALPGGYTGHSLRHAFAARIDDETNGDLAVLQDLLGHRSLNTVRIYVPKNISRMRAAVEQASA